VILLIYDKINMVNLNNIELQNRSS